MKRLTAFVGLLALLLPGAPAWAVLSGASVAPANLSASFNRPATLNLRWTVTAGTANPGPVVAQSPVLLVTAPGGGRILGQVPRRVQGTVMPGASAMIVETVQLPRSLMQTLYQARQADGSRYSHFEVYRTFSDADNSVSAAPASLYLTGGAGDGLFDISRLALYFDDQSTVRLVPRGDSVQAVLDIQFTGSGQLAGVWELADPTSTAGQPIFRPLRMERTSLVGAQAMQIQGPELPTDREGVHLLRFRLTAPRTDFEPVLIRYVVTADAVHEHPPENVRPERPHSGALVGAETTFAWRADRPASAYQLEIYSRPQETDLPLPALGGPVEAPPARIDQPPLTGMLLEGETHSTLLSALVLRRLEPGRAYWWRVRAIGADGDVIGESPLQEIRTP